MVDSKRVAHNEASDALRPCAAAAIGRGGIPRAPSARAAVEGLSLHGSGALLLAIRTASLPRLQEASKKHKWRMSASRHNAQLYSMQWTAPSRSGSSSGDCVLGDAILAEPRCARTVVFVPQGHGKQKLIIPRMLEDKLRQKMGCGVYRTVHIAHDGALVLVGLNR